MPYTGLYFPKKSCFFSCNLHKGVYSKCRYYSMPGNFVPAQQGVTENLRCASR